MLASILLNQRKSPALSSKMKRNFLRNLRRAAIAASLTTAAAVANAVPYFYVDWLNADVSAGTAHGLITLPGSSPVTVDFKATNADGTPGTLAFAQTSGGSNYWTPTSTYISAQVSNGPSSTDILALNGGLNQTYTVTLGEAIKDPIMAITSLGTPDVSATYDFNVPFSIVSQGPAWWGGGSDTSLVKLAGDVLKGNEGSGTIQFLGTFKTFSWTVPTPEYWHGFTFGIRNTEAREVPEPATLVLFGVGLLGLAVSRRRKI